jgi:hypothetical protein
MAAVDLYWLPLGARGHSVGLNGLVFEALAARLLVAGSRRGGCADRRQCEDCGVVFADIRGGPKCLLRLPLEQLLAADRATSPVTPVTSANAAISASTANAPAPGFTKITIPKTIDARPVRTSDVASLHASGSRNDR